MRLSWTEPALADLRCIGAYLEREARPEVAVTTLEAILVRSTSLTSFVFAGPPLKDQGVRSLRVHGTPYILLYRLGEDIIIILRVRHEHENWRKPA